MNEFQRRYCWSRRLSTYRLLQQRVGKTVLATGKSQTRAKQVLWPVRAKEHDFEKCGPLSWLTPNGRAVLELACVSFCNRIVTVPKIVNRRP